MIRGGVVRMRWSALESSGTIGVGFSVVETVRYEEDELNKE